LNVCETEEVSKPKEPWQMFLSTLTGKTITVTVNPEGLVFQIFRRYEDREGVSSTDVRLIYASKQLQPDRLISDYGIGRNSTIHVVLRMLGGTNDGDFDTGRLDTLSVPWVAGDSENEGPL
jgi:Ubiquitin family